MTMPPPDEWPPPSGSPHNQGHPYGRSDYGIQQPPPGWQQGNWSQQPGPPAQKGNSLKWLLVAVAVLLVIGIGVGATLFYSPDGGGRSPPPATKSAQNDLASAEDAGPIDVITDEPTCKTFLDINNSLGDVQRNGWSDVRATLGPASEWTSEQRNQVEAVASATRAAADQMIALAKQTPHRLVREIYEQFIAYGRAYAERVASYRPADNGLATANVNASAALFGICQTIEYGSASRSIAVSPSDPPTKVATVGDPDSATPFLTTPGDTCSAWQTASDKFDATTSDWQRRDANVPASEWTPDQRAIDTAARPYLTTFADDMTRIGRDSGNPVLEDFAAAAAIYLRATVAAGDRYVSADSWLSYVAFRLNLLVVGACRAT